MTKRVIIVCGSRDWTDEIAIDSQLRMLNVKPSEWTVRHGAARGADAIADKVARALGFGVESLPAAWAKHGRSAGPLRNQSMLDAGGVRLVLAFTSTLMRGNRLSGTGDMIARALGAGINVRVFPPRKGPCRSTANFPE